MLSELNYYKITYSLIAVNVLLYLITSLVNLSMIEMDLEILVNMGALYGPFVVGNGEWWRLVSAMFLHGGMTHLLMNMFSLYLVGRGAELYFNVRSYLVLYFFSGLIGSMVSLYVHPLSVGVGASGAIFGIFGALAGFFLAHRERIEAHTKAFMKSFSVIIVINVVLGLSIEAIDMSAHIGGLITGFMGGFAISKNPKWLWVYSIVMLLVMYAFYVYLPFAYIQMFF